MHKVKNTNDGRKRRKPLDCLNSSDGMQRALPSDWM